MGRLKIFVTHSWHDLEFSKELYTNLEKEFSPWLDIERLQGGDDLVKEINDGLENCDVHIPILSPEALHSSWVQDEISAAIALSHRANRKNGKTGLPKIIPVLARNCDLPPLVASKIYGDFTEVPLNELAESPHLDDLKKWLRDFSQERERQERERCRRKRLVWALATIVFVTFSCIAFLGVYSVILSQPPPPSPSLTHVPLSTSTNTDVPAVPTGFSPTLTQTRVIPPRSQIPTQTATLVLTLPLGPIAKGKIAFGSNRNGDPVEIWVMNTDGTNQQLTANIPKGAGDPAFSPDGRFIAFSTPRNGPREIWTMNSDGSNQRQLTRGTEDFYPAWVT